MLAGARAAQGGEDGAGDATAAAIPRPVPAGMVPFPRRGCHAAKGEVSRARPAAPGCPRVPAVWCGAGGSLTGMCPRAPMLGRAAWHWSYPALGATSLGRSWVPRQSHRAISQRAIKFGLTDLPLECAMRNEIGAVSLVHPWDQGVGWCQSREAETHVGLLACTQHPRAHAGVFAGRPPQCFACTQGHNAGANRCSYRARCVRLPTGVLSCGCCPQSEGAGKGV